MKILGVVMEFGEPENFVGGFVVDLGHLGMYFWHFR